MPTEVINGFRQPNPEALRRRDFIPLDIPFIPQPMVGPAGGLDIRQLRPLDARTLVPLSPRIEISQIEQFELPVIIERILARRRLSLRQLADQVGLTHSAIGRAADGSHVRTAARTIRYATENEVEGLIAGFAKEVMTSMRNEEKPKLSGTFRDQLGQALKRAGLSGKQLAEMTGVDRSTVSRFLAENRSPSLKHAARWIAFLGANKEERNQMFFSAADTP